MKLIEIRDLVIGYQTPIIEGIDMEISSGDYWGLIGPNGSGKTTLIKTILGLISPISGELKVQVPKGFPAIAYVPQHTDLNPEFPLTVEEIILMGVLPTIPLQKVSNAALENYHKYIELLGISHLVQRNYSDLSGGERQKVLIARALTPGSPLLLLDEPTNGMDIASEREILNIVKDLNQNEGFTIIFISHILSNLLNEARNFALINKNKIILTTLDELLKSEILTDIYEREIIIESTGSAYLLNVGKRKNS
ncbi:metal ABC transporter ATP-binding protein [Candidatus Riflebacteria bacterium]